MPIKFGSSHYEELKARELLLTHHRVDIRLELMDLSHKHTGNISDMLLSGQVNIDTTADSTSRSASLELLDPYFKLKLDDDAPNDGALYFNKMVRVTFIISTPDREKSYFIPIFTGPLTKLDRSGALLNVEAQGKEILASANIWRAKTYKKRLKKTDIIEQVMRAAGEVSGKMQLVKRDNRMGNNVSATRKTTFWALAVKIARSLRLQLFYDGRGVLRLRKMPSKTTFTFNGKSLVTEPDTGYDSQENYNSVIIIGGKRKGARKKLTYKRVAPSNHPMSPKNLGRNGTKRFIPLVIEDDSIKSRKAARKLAQKELQNALRQDVEVAFDSLPIPFLEENDLCRFNTENSSGSFRLQKMSIPLTAGGSSSIGYLRRVSPKKGPSKGKKKRK
jgi:hypothetical protein